MINMYHHQHQYPNYQQTGQQLSITPQTLYHYTTSNGAQCIRSSSMIVPGKRSDQYGQVGVYLSSMDPSQHFRPEIVDSIHGQRSGRHNSADECVVVYTNQLDPNRLRPVKQDLYVYSGTIPVSPQMVIDKPRCVRAGNQFGGRGSGGVRPQQWPVQTPLPSMGTTYAPPPPPPQYNNFGAPAQGYPPPPPQQSVPYAPPYNPSSAGHLPPGPATPGAYPYPQHTTPPPPYQANSNNNSMPNYSSGQQTTGAPPPPPPLPSVQSIYQPSQSIQPYSGIGIQMPQPFSGGNGQQLPGQPIPSQQYTGTGSPQPYQPQQQQQYTGHQTGYRQSQPNSLYSQTTGHYHHHHQQPQQQQQTTGAPSSGFEQSQPSQQYQTGQTHNR